MTNSEKGEAATRFMADIEFVELAKDYYVDGLRKEIEKCDLFGGFIINNSAHGGTGGNIMNLFNNNWSWKSKFLFT